ncbi:hypothetical protein H1R20_g3690, partial [Candolleomyces eurysporus]
MDSTNNSEEGITGGGVPPISTPQPYPNQSANPFPFPYQHAASAFNFQGGFNGFIPPSVPQFPQPQPGTFNFPHGLATPNQTPSNQGKRPRMDDDANPLPNYGASGGWLERYQQLRDDHNALQQRVEVLEAALGEMSIEKATVATANDADSKRIPELEQLVHDYAFQLMDIQKSRGPAARTNLNCTTPEPATPEPELRLDYTLPDPGGVLPGNPNLKVPDWTVARPNSNTDNKKFQQAILELIKINNGEKVAEHGWSDEDIMRRIQSAFRTFIKHYKQQNDPIEREKAQNKNLRAKMQGRQKTKLERRVGAFPEFEKRHGKEATQGYRQLLQKAAMSSDDETPGKADKGAWERKLVRFYYALDKISFEKMKATVNSQRFHGFKENDNENAPRRSNRDWKLYECMVSKGWAKANHDNTPKCPNPPNFSADLMITDDELFPADREEIELLESYYGDDEMED